MLKRPVFRIVFVVLTAALPAWAGETKPAPTGFAALADAERLPTWSEPVRVQYLTFLATLSPRAFALSPNGTFWAWQSGNENAMRDALQRCDQRAQQACQLYAVDDDVVWPVR
jgi:hypothetical protein